MCMEECYGGPEIIVKAVFDKLDNFPKISNREPLKLRELRDLLKEIDSAKLEGYLPGLAYLDTARGVTPIVNKLPHGLQEKWMTLGSQYELQHQVAFPPFTFFTEFVCRETHTRNDPSFTLNLSAGNPIKPESPMKRYGQSKNIISVHKTEVSHTQTNTANIPSSKPDFDR